MDMKSLQQGSFKVLATKAKRFFSILLSAYMLGMSNVIMEEDRMINDTRAKVEQQEVQNEDND